VFDTAEIYSIPMREETYGETEKIIGNWFEKNKKRKEVILATKVCGNTSNKYIRGGGNNFGKKKIGLALEESLKRLKTDYIDLYQIHWPERNTNFFGKHGYEHDEDDNDWESFEEVLESLDQFINQGKIRYIGLSNETAWGLSKFFNFDNSKNLDKPHAVSFDKPIYLILP
jgi:aryl-alcohol dehydrogenase-like predicted oxidoreductase